MTSTLRQPRAIAGLCLALLAAPAAHSQSFSSCPATAFLVQETVARLYGVDVSTGYVELLAADLETSGKVNGIGFNLTNGYIYGWSYEHRTLARLGSRYQVEPIPLARPLDDNYFVGDVAIDGSAYYAFKRGSGGSHGLWRIDLLETSPTYLTPVRIIDGQALSPAIYDFAFHPYNGLLYSVTSRGDLITIDPGNGTMERVARLSQRGTFGAVYFDVNANLYISRNTDGAIFRINVNDSRPDAEWYSQGPRSSNNDGARCALAPVDPTPASQIDFGDAPDSYGTTLDSNGARHNLEDSDVWLGASVDAEPQAWLSPDADDQTTGDDEDGVSFISDLTAGETALVAVESTGSGFINAWIDFDHNGFFDSDEKVVDQRVVYGGQEIIAIDVPETIQNGGTWSRWRISKDRNIGPVGGVSSGEVEDHPVTLFGRRVTTVRYPGGNDYVTLAYEDLWPTEGDYDMNDVVLVYRTAVNTYGTDNRPDEQLIDSITVSGGITAVGAALDNGFAVETTGVPRWAIDEARVSLIVGGEKISHSILEPGAGNEHAVFIIFPNVHDYVSSTPGCSFYRTEDYCGGVSSQSNFELTIPLSGDIYANQLEDLILNPFIFGTQARRREVHLKGRNPTAKADFGALGSSDDASDPSREEYYQTAKGLPWAMIVSTEWQHPKESHDVLLAYPGLSDYVTTNGMQKRDWHAYDNADASRLYREQ